MTNTDKNNEIPLRDAVRDVLDKAAAAGAKQPTMRGVRAIVGRGSMTTISNIIKEWQIEQLQGTGSLPEAFSEKAAQAIVDAVWGVVLPILQERAQAIQSQADARINIETSNAAKIREAADEALAEAVAKEEERVKAQEQVTQLTGRVAELNGALNEAHALIGTLQVALEEKNKQLNDALTRAATADAELMAMKGMLPFIDPKHLSKLSK